MNLLAKSGKIQSLIRQLSESNFSVYLTSDHGNTLCKGIGAFRNSGVEVETKAKRMMIFKDFASLGEEVLINTYDYPGYYMDKNYKYRVCKNGISFDVKNSQVMTHGGMSIDEVIVPFVKIKAVRKNG